MDLKKLSKDELIKYIKLKTNNAPDMVYRDISSLKYNVAVVYNEHVCNSEFISNFVIKSISNIIYDNSNFNKLNNIEKNSNKNKVTITKINDKESKNKEKQKNEELFNLLKSQIYFSKAVEFDYNKDDLFYYLYSGFAIIVLDNHIIALETRAFLNRAIAEPTNERSLKGPKDAFNENYSQNIGLIRKRLKDDNLKLLEERLGRRSKTKIGILYIEDICKKNLLNEVVNSLKQIEIDAVFDSNTLSEFLIARNNTTIFPTIISTERPDLVSNYLLQGRVVIITENSPFAIVFPTVISDFFKHMDDYYEKSNSIGFIRCIRYLAFFITIFMPAIYVALTTFNQEALPTQLLVSFATQRASVPASAFIEAIVMIISFEILREGDFRVPSMAGSTLSIVGALILRRSSSFSWNSFTCYDYSCSNNNNIRYIIYRCKFSKCT